MHAFVLVGDVVGAAFRGEGYPLYTREAGELADVLCFEVAGVGVPGKNAPEVGGHGLPAAGVVLDQDALFVAAVHVAGYQVELLAEICERFIVVNRGRLAHAPTLAALREQPDFARYLGKLGSD